MKRMILKLLSSIFIISIKIDYYGILEKNEKKPILLFIYTLLSKKHNIFKVSNIEYEKSLIMAHDIVTRANDRVLVVGGGEGISGLYAAKIAFNGEVHIFEAGLESYQRILNTPEIMESRNLKIYHNLLGEDINTYGGSVDNAKVISPMGIFDYDVIELDCEGSEYSILDNLSYEPRNIICEFHPCTGINYDSFFDSLLKKYRFIFVTDNKHNEIDFIEARRNLDHGEIIHVIFERLGI